MAAPTLLVQRYVIIQIQSFYVILEAQMNAVLLFKYQIFTIPALTQCYKDTNSFCCAFQTVLFCFE